MEKKQLRVTSSRIVCADAISEWILGCLMFFFKDLNYHIRNQEYQYLRTIPLTVLYLCFDGSKCIALEHQE